MTDVAPPKSPYSVDGPPQTQLSLVCYADILGYKALSRQALAAGQGGPFLERIHRALAKAHERVWRQARGIGNVNFFDVKVFSDNVVVGYPIRNAYLNLGEPELGDMLSIFAELQTGLAMEGFFLRGGVALGQHYMDADIVFGEALLDAVDLDVSGGPPRLVLSETAKALVNAQLEAYKDLEHSPHYEYLLRDADGHVFVNYLTEAFIAFPDGGVFLDVIAAHRDAVVSGLRRYKSNPDIRAKYEWLARYHNFVCVDFANNHPVPHGDDDPEYGAAAEEAQQLRQLLVEIEGLAAYPSRLSEAPI